MSNLFTPLWWQYHDIVVPKDGISIKTKYFLVFFEFVCMWTWLMRNWLITNLQSKDILKYSFRFFLPIQTITWEITRVVEYFTPRWQKSGFFEKYHSNDTNFVLKFHPSLQSTIISLNILIIPECEMWATKIIFYSLLLSIEFQLFQV